MFLARHGEHHKPVVVAPRPGPAGARAVGCGAARHAHRVYNRRTAATTGHSAMLIKQHVCRALAHASRSTPAPTVRARGDGAHWLAHPATRSTSAAHSTRPGRRSERPGDGGHSLLAGLGRVRPAASALHSTAAHGYPINSRTRVTTTQGVDDSAAKPLLRDRTPFPRPRHERRALLDLSTRVSRTQPLAPAARNLTPLGALSRRGAVVRGLLAAIRMLGHDGSTPETCACGCCLFALRIAAWRCRQRSLCLRRSGLGFALCVLRDPGPAARCAVVGLAARSALVPNYRRIFGLVCISAAF